MRQLPGPDPATDPRPGKTEARGLFDLIADMDLARVTTSLVFLHEDCDDFLRLASGHPGRLYGLAYYDATQPREGLERVRALCEKHPALILGVHAAPAATRQDPRDKEFAPLYAHCAARDLPIHFHIGGDSATEEVRPLMPCAVLASICPRLKIVCLQDGGHWGREVPDLLRKIPNLFLGVGAPWPHQAEGRGEAMPFRELLRAVGSRKLLFGSGWLGSDPTYFQRVEAVRRLPWWQRGHVARGTATRLHGRRILGTQV